MTAEAVKPGPKPQPAPRCTSCGRRDWIDAVDNYGQPYKGCANCRIADVITPSNTEASR